MPMMPFYVTTVLVLVRREVLTINGECPDFSSHHHDTAVLRGVTRGAAVARPLPEMMLRLEWYGTGAHRRRGATLWSRTGSTVRTR